MPASCSTVHSSAHMRLRFRPAAFAITKREMRQAALERAKLDASRSEIEQIWTAPDTLNRIRDYVARVLRK